MGTQAEGYSLKLAAAIRGHRIQAIRHKEEIPIDWKGLPTLGEVADRYLAWSQRNKASYAHDETRWRLHLEPEFGDERIDTIRAGDLERLKDRLSATRSEATVREVLVFFGIIWGFGVEKGPIAGAG